MTYFEETPPGPEGTPSGLRSEPRPLGSGLRDTCNRSVGRCEKSSAEKADARQGPPRKTKGVLLCGLRDLARELLSFRASHQRGSARTHGGTKRKTLNLCPGTADHLQEEDDASGRDCAAGRCAGRYRSRTRPARHDDARGAAARRRLRNRHFTKRGREYRYLHRRCALRLRRDRGDRKHARRAHHRFPGRLLTGQTANSLSAGRTRMEVIQQMAAVAVVLLLLGATLWVLRRRGFAGMAPVRRSAGRRMECLERLPLGPQHTLHLVRVGETELLLALSDRKSVV